MAVNKVALVTGAAAGLGRAIAVGLAERGYRVAGVDIDAHALKELSQLETAGPAILSAPADLSDDTMVAAMLAQVEANLGPVEILISNAGLGPGFIRADFLNNPFPTWVTPPDKWRTMVAVNLNAIQLLSHHLVPGMLDIGWGRIINVTTNFDSMLRPHFAAYGSAKAGAEALSAAMAEELKDTGVTVNVVIPGGPADTGMVPSDGPLDRAQLVSPSAMAAPIAWLVSDKADEVTGRRFIAENWEAPAPGFDPRHVGASIGWPGLAGSDRLVPMA